MFGTGSLWRQGSVLTSESVKALNVSSQHDALVVVISHDCDLANTAETFSEAIICKKISNVDGNYSNGRNARKLHLSIVTKEGATLNLELEHSNRMQISQSSIGEVGQPSDSEAVVGEEKRILKHWLASRYGRPAFPTSFEDRLRDARVGKTHIHASLGSLSAKNTNNIIAIYFDLGEDRNVELLTGQPYIVSIFVVYRAEGFSGGARDRAYELCDQIRNLFEKGCGTPADSTTIALESCNAVSDEDFSLAQIRRMDQWRLEHRSLGDSLTSEDVVTSVPS
jgi:hypothetical protein